MRPRARWGIAPLLAAPAGAWALGLGPMEMQSALNQPFRAEIELSATAEELEGLRVFLADADTFERSFELHTIEAQQFRERIGMAADSKCGDRSTANFGRRLRDPGNFQRDFPGGGQKLVEIDTHRLSFQRINAAFVAHQFSAQHQVW